MKVSIQGDENLTAHKLISLIEKMKSSDETLGRAQFWAGDLAIYMGYDYDPAHPSVRLRRLNLRKPLRELGVRADIIYRYDDLLSYNNILISHFNEMVIEQCIDLRKLGKTLYFCHTEHLWGIPSQTEVFNLCDYIVCCSNKLKDFTQEKLTSSFTKAYYLPDMAEKSSKNMRHIPKKGKSLRCVYVGMGGNSYLARDLQPLIESMGMTLTVISEWADADIKWDQDTYLDIMSQYDIAICPQNDNQPAKSHVKVVTAMSVGLPLICSPSPAYKEIVKHGVNGFIASSTEEWSDCLNRLKDFNLRKSMNYSAMHTAQNYTPEAIAVCWLDLLCKKKLTIALINNTLKDKYMSYGDVILDKLRLNGYRVDEFRYEDVDILLPGYDAYLFIEKRYNTEDIAEVNPRILFTQEEHNLNTLPQYDAIVTEDLDIYHLCKQRGFVNVIHQKSFDMDSIMELLATNCSEKRKQHNEKIHTASIDRFPTLQLPETRWKQESVRDSLHIKYSMFNTEIGDNVLDIGSADGWLSLYLAKEGRKVTALDFVNRGIAWTLQQAKRLNIHLNVQFGFIEDLSEIFKDKKFDCIIAYEILEHLDYRRIPWYLEKMEELLATGGKILISLPKQDLHDNIEHLWSPSIELIEKIFKHKPCYQLQWADIPNHEVDGNWFLKYRKGPK